MKTSENYFRLALIVLMVFLSLFRFSRIISSAFSPSSAVDLHSYWYSGNFVRRGVDPFDAYLNGRELIFPIQFLDGKTINSLPEDQQELARVPANTALMVLLLSPLAFFPWQTAKVSWMIFNIALLFIVPTLVIRLYPLKTKLSKISKLAIYLALWGLLATSSAIGNGQTTFLIFALSLFSILAAPKHWLIAGIALGIALSKYSLSLPFFIFILMFQKNYKVVIMAVILQILGFVTISVMTVTPFIQIISEYSTIAVMHLGLPGIHLLAILSPQLLAYFIISILSILVLGAYFYMITVTTNKTVLTTHEKTHLTTVNSKNYVVEKVQIHTLNLMNFWILLSIYHREYDAITFVLFVSMIIVGFSNNYWNFSVTSKRAVIICTLIITLAMSRLGVSFAQLLPTPFVPFGQLLSSDWVATFALLTGLCINIWLSFRINDTEQLFQVSI